MIDSKIIELNSTQPGPTLAVFAGVHGNEMAGVLALEALLPTLDITKGKLYIAFANPPAIAGGVRMVNKNLNRCFVSGNNGSEPEDVRARELMAVLDGCDALLDIHMFYDDNGIPFVICEPDALDLANKFDVGIISTNWTDTEPGATDGYMHVQGKIGICIECGPISKAAEYKNFAIKTIYQFLRYYDMTNEEVVFSTQPKRIIAAQRSIYKTAESFQLAKGFHNFDKLAASQTIAVDANQTYVARAKECIIFPHYGARVGEEAYIIGKDLN
jgi:succinylglutamate desuccinylase